VPGYPRPLAETIARALARDPKDRWQTAADLRDALDTFVRDQAGQAVDPDRVHAIVEGILERRGTAPWERIYDEAMAGQEPTRVWQGPTNGTAPPESVGRNWEVVVGRVRRAMEARPTWAAGGAMLFVIIWAFCGVIAVRSCIHVDPVTRLEPRLARIEDLLGLADAAPPAAAAPGAASAAAAPSSAAADASAPEEVSPSCALARVTSYRVWQEAFAHAKTIAGPAEAACAGIWNERKKQACYKAATAQAKAILVARDATIEGGGPARDAVKAVKDDPKNDAIARARSASESAFTTCGDAPESAPGGVAK
jgi:hypothetical protein